MSRFGVMFFENPKAAFKNINLSMKSRARLNFVCWSNMLENEFFIEGTSIIEKYTEKITKYPGPRPIRVRGVVDGAWVPLWV